MRLPIQSTRRFGALVGAALLALGVGACGHPVERKLQGRWLGEGVENFDDALTAAATGWARGTSLEFAGSDLTVSIPAEEARSGSYKVVKVNRNDVDIAVTRKDGAIDRARFSLDDEARMRWRLSGGRSVLLRRQE